MSKMIDNKIYARCLEEEKRRMMNLSRKPSNPKNAHSSTSTPRLFQPAPPRTHKNTENQPKTHLREIDHQSIFEATNRPIVDGGLKEKGLAFAKTAQKLLNLFQADDSEILDETRNSAFEHQLSQTRLRKQALESRIKEMESRFQG